MADILTAEQRHRNMSRIRSRDTIPEKKLRSLLFRKGYRFRLYDKRLPGTPDIVLKKYLTVIFVHGCFWHRHTGCRFSTTPASNAAFWEKKFAGNTERDRKKETQLVSQGWHVIIVWECQIRFHPNETLRIITSFLQGITCNSECGIFDLSDTGIDRLPDPGTGNQRSPGRGRSFPAAPHGCRAQ